MKVRLGLSSLYLINNSFEELVSTLRSSAVELWEIVDEGELKLSRERVRVLREIKGERGLGFTVHAPFNDLNIASTTPQIREVSLRILRDSLDFAAELGAEAWVFHPGLSTTYTNITREKDAELNLDGVLHLADYAGGLGVRGVLENLPRGMRGLLSRVEEWEIFYDQLGGGGVELALDLGHANTNGQVAEFVGRLGGRVGHVHAHDNDGSRDAHLAIGEGSIDWPRVVEGFRGQGFSKALIVESTQNPYQSLTRLKEYL